jgi:hypothetical protein
LFARGYQFEFTPYADEVGMFNDIVPGIGSIIGVSPAGPGTPCAPVAPVAPLGIVKANTAFVEVPVFVTEAFVPAVPVVVVPIASVVGPAGPCAPVSPWGPAGKTKFKV